MINIGQSLLLSSFFYTFLLHINIFFDSKDQQEKNPYFEKSDQIITRPIERKRTFSQQVFYMT
jgi:hypothetical protein